MRRRGPSREAGSFPWIAGSADAVSMARAMKLAVEAGRLAYKAGRIGKKLYATASSPLEGLPDWTS